MLILLISVVQNTVKLYRKEPLPQRPRRADGSESAPLAPLALKES